MDGWRSLESCTLDSFIIQMQVKGVGVRVRKGLEGHPAGDAECGLALRPLTAFMSKATHTQVQGTWCTAPGTRYWLSMSSVFFWFPFNVFVLSLNDREVNYK